MFKVGDKVKIPKTKSTGMPLRSSYLIRDAIRYKLDYLCVVAASEVDYTINTEDHFIRGHRRGTYFLAKDLELYNPEDHYIGGVTDV